MCQNTRGLGQRGEKGIEGLGEKKIRSVGRLDVEKSKTLKSKKSKRMSGAPREPAVNSGNQDEESLIMCQDRR